MFLAFIVLTTALSAAPPKPRPYTVHDQVSLRRILGFRVSPDGAKVAFSLRTTDLEANRGRMDLWLVNVDGSGLRQLTSHPENDTEPAWSPDGRTVYFLSTRGGSSQVWRLPIDGGEATQVTSAPMDVESFRLSNDGSLLAYSAETFPDCDTLECTKKRVEEKSKEKATGRLYTSLMVRHWDTWREGRRSHLFVERLGAKAPAVDVMKKLDADCPVRPFGGSDDYTFTPDGKGLVFAAKMVGREEAWSTNVDLFFVPISGAVAPRNLTGTNPAADSMPVFSPDGKSLAFLAMSRPGYEADRQRVVVRAWPEGKERVLTEKWDRSAESLVWSPDGKALYTTAWDVGQLGLFAVDGASGAVTRLLSQGHVGGVGVADKHLVLSVDSLSSPADLFRFELGAPTPKAITSVNAEAMAGVLLGQAEQFTFPGAGGDTVHAYLVKPAPFDPTKKYPLAFLIHGGPQGSFGNDWHYRWNPQVYAAHGYAVVMVDFHGSTGYGQAFTDAIRGDWGGKPLEDLRRGFAAAVAKYSFIDKNRACALGASYGGFMINWLASQWNDDFKCLVSHDGNLDERMAYFDTEELWFPEWEHGGTPWENPEGYTKHNPIDHVAKWKLPMLVVHGGKDFRVVDTQGLSAFTVLQRRGIPSQFLHFPDENHWVLKPANSVLWHDTVLSWLDRWTKK